MDGSVRRLAHTMKVGHKSLVDNERDVCHVVLDGCAEAIEWRLENAPHTRVVVFKPNVFSDEVRERRIATVNET